MHYRTTSEACASVLASKSVDLKQKRRQEVPDGLPALRLSEIRRNRPAASLCPETSQDDAAPKDRQAPSDGREVFALKDRSIFVGVALACSRFFHE